MQQTLSNELRSVIERRLRAASPKEVLSIVAALCYGEAAALDSPSILTPEKTAARFEVIGDIVRDQRTGLMWSRQNVGGGRKNWADAKKAAEGCALGGYTNWRLPTLRELLSIVDYERHDPAIDTTAFQCDAAWYWSSTPLNLSPGDCAWVVNFSVGDAYWGGQGGGGFVRAVRPGQSIDYWF
ncbi:MAG TPA: DUF1566 domain-containing protein [Steroidobacteraceae bacterium]